MIRWMLLSLVGAGLTSGSERTCRIPVFRYALERWQPSAYEVVAVHRGPLSDPGRSALEALHQSGANLEVDRIDLSEPVPAKWAGLLETLKLDPPFLAALFPDSRRVAWTGPLTVLAARELSDSPARSEIARRLLGGDSAVWVLLESGDRGRDEAAAALLRTELGRLERTLKIPAPAADDPPLLSEAPLRVAFSVLRLSPGDAKEAAFRRILRSGQPDLDPPIVIPVFGRGRALEAWAGKDLSADLLEEAATFLTGACACEAKELNPGVDLPFAVPWEEGFAAAPPAAPVPTPVLRPRPPEAPSAPGERPTSSPLLWGALLGAGLLVAITGRRLRAVAGPGRRPAASPEPGRENSKPGPEV